MLHFGPGMIDGAVKLGLGYSCLIVNLGGICGTHEHTYLVSVYLLLQWESRKAE